MTQLRVDDDANPSLIGLIPNTSDSSEPSSEGAALHRATPPHAPALAGVQLALESDHEMHKVVWRLAWPSVLTMLLQTFNSFMDRGFVGHLGPDALAAVGVGGQLMFVIFSIGMSISVGATALVARFTGARQPDQARVAGNQALMIGLVAAFISMAVMLPLAHIVVQAMGINHHATDLCVRYLTISLLGVPPLFVMLILSGVYRGVGDTMTPLLISVGVNIIHLGGDYLLIFGSFHAPRLGLPGGAIALASSQLVGSVLYIAAIRRSKVAGLIRAKAGLEKEWADRILRIGIPAALQNLSRILSMLFFTGILARTVDSTAAVAALTIGLTSESVAFMPGFGFSVAASTLAGQGLGAGRPDRAERAGWVSLHQGAAVMTVMGIVFYVFAAQFARIFTHDPTVVRLAVAYLRVSAFAEPFLALGMVLTGALNGAGDTKAPAIAGVVSMWVVRLPLAYLLAKSMHFDAVGAWYAMAASTIVSGIWAWGLFRWGHWKHVRV